MTTKSDSKPRAAAQADYSKVRRPAEQDDFELNATAQAFLASLEESVRPNGLAASFPRIVNCMAKLWRKPLQMDRYFEQLLTDGRGNRHGFPLRVLMELSALKDYYQAVVFPARRDVWDADDGSTGSK